MKGSDFEVVRMVGWSPPDPGARGSPVVATIAAVTAALAPACPRALTSYKPYWAKRFGPAPFLPMSRAEMDALGWDSAT